MAATTSGSSGNRIPELRKDAISNRWVIFSPARAKRPSEFKSNSPAVSDQQLHQRCPFCIGNEHQCAPEIFRFPPDNPDWTLRLIQNLYPALSRDLPAPAPPRLANNLTGSVLDGFGFHDVIIETPVHSVQLLDLSPHDVAQVFLAHIKRIHQLATNDSIKYVQVFKNHGASAGASMTHSHSQMIALPVIPPNVSARLGNMKDYFEKTGKCCICEIQQEDLLIDTSDDFSSLVPYAATFPFEIWIVPRHHSAHFHELDAEKAVDLGRLLKLMLRKMSLQLNNPPFNFMIHTSPLHSNASELAYTHWFIQISQDEPGNHTFNCCKPLAAVASSVPYQPTNNLDYLEKEEFIGHDGVTFEAVGDGSVVAKMELKNGSVVSMLLPSGVITSYKAPMWHGGTVELLHTAVSEGDHGAALIQGGVSSNFTFTTDDCQVSFSPTHWVLNKIKSHPEESIKVELINKSSEDKIGIKYIVTLEEDGLQSEFEVQNSMHSPLQITGSILSHLTVSSPEATYAVGLERSNYWRRPLLESEFILSPPPDSNYQEGFGKIWNIPALQQLIPHWGATKDQNKEDMSGEEEDGYKNLRDKISLIYTDAPRSITVIDRGRRNSLSIGRIGLDEMYLFSPGSKVEIYSKYSYILVGQTAILKPIVVNPQDVWNGGQYIHNPNL
ncbi:hypothetical protein AHAS_Ahas10G0187100 [Arachis hypogaea]